MRYKAKVLVNGLVEERDIEASNELELRDRLSVEGVQLLAAKAQASIGFRASDFSLSLFTQELVALLEAGLSLTESVETLREKSAQDGSRLVLTQMIEGLYQGLPLSKVLAKQAAHFPALYVATVASAEKTGHLADALRRYHHYQARVASVRKKVVSALIYPLVIVTIGGGVLLFLLFYVIPRFSQIYQSMRNLPFAASIMLWWGNLVHEHGKLLFGGIILSIVGIVLALRSPLIRAALGELMFRIPRLGQLRRLFALTRFYRTVGLLLSGGLSAVAALELATQLLPADMRAALKLALIEIRAGQALSNVLPRFGLTTPVAERLLRVGEQSGELAAMNERIALFCDEELDRAIDLFTRLFEPLLMLGIGILIGTIVFLLYMPIFELAGSVQ